MADPYGSIAVVSKNWLAAQTDTALTERQRAQHDAVVAAELYRLRTAYPTQARNFTQQEVDAINRLWAEVFAQVDPQLLHTAVMRYIVTDRREKKFFPEPGSIAGVVEEIIAEQREEERENEAMENNYRVFQAIREGT